MIFGDVLATLAIICGVPFTTWAMVIACRLVFPELSERAANRMQSKAFASFWTGLAVTAIGLFLAIIFFNLPNPVARFVGADIVSFLLALSIVGCAGIGAIAGHRIQAHDERISEYAAFVRGSAFVIVACMSPLVGWFFIMPIALITAIGAGLNAVLRRTRVVATSAA